MTFEELDLPALLKGKRHEGYKENVDHATDMSVHMYGLKPVKLLERVRPREDPAITSYRLQSYEAITTATADKAVVTAQKIMNPKLSEIKFPSTGADLEQYLFKNYPFYHNVMSFVNDVVIRAMLADPNGVLVVTPLRSDVPDTTQVSPVVTVVHSQRVWDYKYGDWYLIHQKEEKDAERIIDYFHYIDKVTFICFKTIKTRDNLSTVIESQYNHTIGVPPVWPLMGIINQVEHYGVTYRSFFSAALPYWNKAVTSDSDLDGAFINHMHPIRVELTEDCDFSFNGSACIGGKYAIEDGKSVTCPSCFGTGRKSVKSPYGVYQVQKPGPGEQTTAPIAPVSYVPIPVEPTKMLEIRVKSQLDSGLASLNMLFEVGESQSGIAKAMDRSELYDFLLTLSTVVFDIHIANIIKFTAHYMYMNKTDGKLPAIQKPTSFDLLSVSEESALLAAAKTAGLDSTYIRIKMKSVIQKDLHGKVLEQNIALDSLTLNTLSGYAPNDVITMLNTGLIKDVDAQIYANINALIQQAYENNREFYKLSYDMKRAALIALLGTLEAEPTNVPPTNLPDGA